MAHQSVTQEVKELLDLGFTIEELNEKLDVTIGSWDGEGTYQAFGRREQYKVQDFHAQQTEVRFARRGGVWCVRGRKLTAGETVTVTKRYGETSTVTIDEIVEVDPEGFFIGTILKRQPRRRVVNRPGCHYCGLPLNRWGSCDECGDPL